MYFERSPRLVDGISEAWTTEVVTKLGRHVTRDPSPVYFDTDVAIWTIESDWKNATSVADVEAAMTFFIDAAFVYSSAFDDWIIAAADSTY